MFWFLIVLTINVNGTVLMNLQYPNNTDVNNKESCEAIGALVANETRLKNDINETHVFWLCSSVPYETVIKTFKPI